MKQTTEYAFETTIEHHLTTAGGYEKATQTGSTNPSFTRCMWTSVCAVSKHLLKEVYEKIRYEDEMTGQI
jgi:hypothetical protein